METWEINGNTLEYDDETHSYIVDGIYVPSVTQILQKRFGNKYEGVNAKILNKAAENGTKVHNAIEKYVKTGEKDDLKEVKNFIFLQKHYKFAPLNAEIPLIIYKEGKPIAAGKTDLTIEINGQIGGADIKRVSSLDKEYLGYQLNLYRIGMKQSYGIDWKFLKGIHLRNDTRKFVSIPIKEQMAWDLINEYLTK